MSRQATAIERDGRTAVVHLAGDIVVTTARPFYGLIRGLVRRRDLDKIILDFSDVGRFDSSGVAAIELAKRSIKRSGKRLELDKLDDRARAAFELLPKEDAPRAEPEAIPGKLELIGENLIDVGEGLRDLAKLVLETLRQLWLIVTRRARMPA